MKDKYRINKINLVVLVLTLAGIGFVIFLIANASTLSIGDSLIIISIWTFMGFYIIQNSELVEALKR